MNEQKVFFSDNIKFLREQKKITQGTMAEKLGLSRSKLNALENGQTKSPTQEDLLAFSQYFKISIDSLIKVDLSKIGGWKLKELQAGNDIYMTGSKVRILAITVDKDKNENVEYVPIKAKAGYRSGFNDPAFIATLPKFSLPNLPKNGTYRMFPTSGDSMLPIPEGSDIVAKFVEDWKGIKPGTPCIVILRADQDFVFKNVTIEKEGQIRLESSNKTYTPYNVAAEDVMEIWVYHQHLTGTLPQAETDMQQIMRSMEEMKEQINKLNH